MLATSWHWSGHVAKLSCKHESEHAAGTGIISAFPAVALPIASGRCGPETMTASSATHSSAAMVSFRSGAAATAVAVVAVVAQLQWQQRLQHRKALPCRRQNINDYI